MSHTVKAYEWRKKYKNMFKTCVAENPNVATTYQKHIQLYDDGDDYSDIYLYEPTYYSFNTVCKFLKFNPELEHDIFQLAPTTIFHYYQTLSKYTDKIYLKNYKNHIQFVIPFNDYYTILSEELRKN